MRIGILADVHANTAALQAVLADGRGHVDRWWFIGDVVGYGPVPVETLELLRAHVNTRHWIIGNHDAWLVGLHDPWRFRKEAIYTLTDHRQQLEARCSEDRLWQWCKRNWTQHRAEPRLVRTRYVDCWLAHACVHPWPDDIVRYVFPWPNLDGPDQRPLTFNALRQRRRDNRPLALIHGHTHVPYILVWRYDHDYWEMEPIHYGKLIHLRQLDAVLLNPGSVGQPRNADPLVHAAYGILDMAASTFEFRRVPYDSEPTRLAMAGRNYDISLIWMLEGAHDKNPLKDNGLWIEWRRTYKEQPWGWEPADLNDDL